MARARSALLALRKLIGDSPRPMGVIDAQRAIQYVNPALATWVGLAGDALIGQRCDYHWEIEASPVTRAAAALAPPPECLAGQTEVERVISLATDAATRLRRATFIPLSPGQESAVLLVLDVVDIDPSLATSAVSGDDESAQLHLTLAQFRASLGPLYELHQLIGEHPAIERAREQIQAAAVSRARVVIQGPPGSGREHVARTIFYLQSPLRAGAIVPLSCSLLDAELLQTTIAAFIHTKPEIEVTGPASLLLLDVDALSTDAQRSLMAVLHIEELQAHAIATSSQSLTELARKGLYRADLAHHLSTIVIELPPLAARKDDIPLLAQKLLEHVNAESQRQLSGWTETALDVLVAHEWPGNVDELTEVVRQACRRATGAWVTVDDLPSYLREPLKAAAHPLPAPEPLELAPLLERLEREVILRAMRLSKRNRARAARLLGISRAKLLRRMSQLGMNDKDVSTS